MLIGIDHFLKTTKVNSMYISIAVIVAVIVLWSCFDSKTAPGATQWRPYGITALVGIGAGIYFSPVPSPYLVAGESCLASLVTCTLISAVLLIGGGDRPTRLYEYTVWTLICALLAVTVAVAYLIGGVPALYGALGGNLILVSGALTLRYK